MDYDTKDLQSVLLYMRGKFGAGIFEEPPRMFSVLLDISPGLKPQGNVLRQMSEAELLRELRGASESGGDLERARAVAHSRQWLADYLMLSDERAAQFITALQAVYGLETEPPKPPPLPSQPIKPPKPALKPQATPTLTTKPQPPKSAIIDSGHTGNCTWTFKSNGVLTISGNGKFNALYDNREKIVSLIIENGISGIGAYCFAFCEKLTSISFPNSLLAIEEGAFQGCHSLINVNLPSRLTSINSWTFCGCNRLKSMRIPDRVTSIKKAAFQDCHDLTDLYIPISVVLIENGAFYGCQSLKKVTIPSGAKVAENAFDPNTTVSSRSYPFW